MKGLFRMRKVRRVGRIRATVTRGPGAHQPLFGWPRLGGLLEHQAEVVEQLALEADAVRADARGEREAEVPAGQVLRHEAGLEKGLLEARLGEALAPLLDRLDVVEPAAHCADQPEMRRRRLLDLLLAERQERAREL